MFLAKSYCDIGNSRSSSSIVAPDGEITTAFEYNGIQRLVRVTDTEGNVTPPFTYDPLGNVLTKQNGEHGGERQDDCLYLRLPPSDGYQQSRPSGKQRHRILSITFNTSS